MRRRIHVLRLAETPPHPEYAATLMRYS